MNEPTIVGKVLFKGKNTKFVHVELEKTHNLEGELIPEIVKSTMKLPPHEDFVSALVAWKPHVLKACELRSFVRQSTAAEIANQFEGILEDIEINGIELHGNTVDSRSVVIVYTHTGYDGLSQKKKTIPIRYGSDSSYTHREEVADLVEIIVEEAIAYQSMKKYDSRMWSIQNEKGDPMQLSIEM